MATLEQCETQSSVLPTISSTLNLFDTFKPSQEEDKDSDEESFHLPMLDCDDDLESNSNKEGVSMADKDLIIPNGETEDDILNKFETTGTPDIDPKIEESILKDIDDLCGKKEDEEIKEAVSDSNNDKISSQKEDCVHDTEMISTEEKPICNGIDSDDKEPSVDKEPHVDKEPSVEVFSSDEKEPLGEIKNSDIVSEKKTSIDDENDKANGDDKIANNQELDEIGIVDGIIDNQNAETTSATDDIKSAGTDENVTDNNLESEVSKETKENVEEHAANATEVEVSQQNNDKEVSHSNEKEDNDEESNKAKDGVIVEAQNNEAKNSESEKMDVDSVETEIDNSLMDEDKPINEPINSNNLANDSTKVEDNLDVLVVESDNGKKEESQTDTDKVESSESTCDKQEKSMELVILNEDVEMEKQPDVDKVEVQKQTSVDDGSKSDNMESEKCENSNDSNKSQNLDCDDLLDISIIRDADEDNASAIAENANDVQSSEKSDNDDQDEGSEKAENDLDESEIEQDESLLTNDRDDHMDFEDASSSNMCEQDNIISGNTSDSENKDDVDTRDSETESKDSSSVLKDTPEVSNDTDLNSDKIQTDEIKIAEKGVNNNHSANKENEDSVKDSPVKLGGKRSLSETDRGSEEKLKNKKIKLISSKSEEIKPTSRNNKVKTLVSFEKFMQNKKFENKLTRSDLEQFCIQKICEAIMHKTDVGELHQTIKKQEQIIENLRKDLQQLTKQTRDLDIVNKKLMNELRSQNGSKKPLVPLKITRSVGLQVKLNINSDNNTRRKVAQTPPAPRTPNNSTTPRPRAIATNSTGVVRQVATSPRKPPAAAPLLSQALSQNRQTTPTNIVKRPPIRPKPAEPPKPPNSSVIDLTDEDDKAAKAKVTTSKVATPAKILTKPIILPQTKNPNIVQNKTVPNKPVNANQNKTVAVGQVKSTNVGNKVGTPTRTVTTLPQGVRLTPTQVKNSITIPASVVTSNSGTTQLMYVVQPTSSLGQVVTTTAGGTQKAVLLNFQPTNGVLTSALNGSAVSVIPTKTTNTVQLKTVSTPRKHPAPLPVPPPTAINSSLKPLLPKPHLSIRKTDTGIILQWRMPYNLDIYEGIASYQLFAYQETNAAPSTDMWRKVGDVKALALPMACTLTQFADKNKYYFAVRSVDVHKRIGAFSDPEEISL